MTDASYTPDQGSQDQQQPDNSWQLPPAPGQFGAPAQRQQQLGLPPGLGGGGGLAGLVGRIAPQLAPYIRSQARGPGQWGQPDEILQGAMAYPGVSPGPFMPQSREMPSLYHAITMGLGRWGSPGVGMSAINMGKFLVAYMNARQKGQQEHMRLALEQFKLSSLLTAQRQEQESTDYGKAYALYGTTKDQKGDPEKMRAMIEATARKYKDQEVLNYLQQGDMPMVEKLLQYRDTHGLDLKKLNAQREAIIRGQQIDLNKFKIDKARAAAQAEKDTADPWRKHPGTPTAPTAPGALPPPPTAPTQGDPDLQWGEPQEKPPEATPSSDTPQPQQPGSGIPLPPDDQQGAAAPTDDTAATDDTDTGDQAQAQPAQQPIQLAQADTGIASDAPSPMEQELAKRRGQGASFDERFSGQQAQQQPPPAQQQPPPAQRQAPPVQPTAWTPPPSRTLDVADKAGWDAAQIDKLGQNMANGTIKIQDLRAIPPAVRAYGEARRAEIERAEDAIAHDPNLQGEAVFQALDKINPEFSGVLRQYVNGVAPVPASAWRNPSYLNRTLALGTKADHTFNATNFTTRAATKRSFAMGQDARNVTSVATLDFHAERFLQNLQRLQRMDPSVAQQYFGTWKINPWKAPPQMQALFAQLDEDAHTVANEYERAVTGGKPTVSGRDEQEKTMNWRWNTPESVISNVQEKQRLAHERMHRLIERYEANVGRGRDAMGDLYRGYAERPIGGEDALGGMATPDAAVAAHAQQMIRGAGQPPAQPGAAAQPNPRQQGAVDWLKANPNDPRAGRVREKLREQGVQVQ
jgi:hypothetical protein